MPLGGKITPARRKDKRAAAKFFVIHRKKGSLTEPFVFSGGPSGNRTPNLLIKSQLLCLVELTARLSLSLIILGGPKKWRARQDSNLRPADSKSDALSGLSYGRTRERQVCL